VFFLDPKIAAGVVFPYDGGILLVQRAIEPAYGKWVFPGGYVDRGETLEAAEGAGLEVLDVENLRPHYVRTTREWVARLEANAGRARALVGERRYRTWIAYLAAASIAFEEGWIAVHQLVARRRQDAARRYRRP